MSIRGQLPYPLFKQHTCIMNPWSEKSWIKKRFFDVTDDNVFAITRNYDCNEFLSDDDRQLFLDMKLNNPRRYNVEGLGNWGISEGLIYENWIEQEFDEYDLMKYLNNDHTLKYKQLAGMDFGYSTDPTAVVFVLANTQKRELYIYDELYMYHATNKQIFEAIKKKGHQFDVINADSEDPRTINELKMLGLTQIKGAKKGPGSIEGGIQRLQDYKIIVHPRCQNMIMELSNYCWDKDNKTGELLRKPASGYDHLNDALRYATEGLHRLGFSW